MNTDLLPDINKTNQQNVLKMLMVMMITFTNFKARLKAHEYLPSCMQLIKIGHMFESIM